MTDADDTTNLRDQLAAHRATLAVYLRQVATHTEAYAPPAQLSGIADARAAITRLKAAHRATLAHYLRQRAQLGTAHEPPGVAHGIAEARAAIRLCKVTLHA